jgi:hypothetical protein
MTLADLLVRIDVALTGCSDSDAAHTATSQSGIAGDAVAFASDGDAYDLSDKGYSRLFWSWEGWFGEHGAKPCRRSSATL